MLCTYGTSSSSQNDDFSVAQKLCCGLNPKIPSVCVTPKPTFISSPSYGYIIEFVTRRFYTALVHNHKHKSQAAVTGECHYTALLIWDVFLLCYYFLIFVICCNKKKIFLWLLPHIWHRFLSNIGQTVKF